MGEAEALDYRIGVGERAEQQREDRINDQKGEDREQRRNPQPAHHAPAHAFVAATHDPGAPARLSVQTLPLAGDRPFWILRSLVPATLVDRRQAERYPKAGVPKWRG